MRRLGFCALLGAALALGLAGCSQPPPAPTPPPSPTALAPAPTAAPPTAAPVVAVVLPTPRPPAPTATPASAPPTPTVPPLPPTPVVTPTRAAPSGRPIAVVIDNEPRGRPQAGLAAADVLYEAIAEFNLTRLVAVFLDGSSEKVGAVRSTRAYHAAIAAEYQAGLAHCLDTPAVPAILAATKVANLDGCRGSDRGFFRDAGRIQPYNLFVSIPELRQAAGGGGTYGGFGRRRPWPDSGEQVDAISFVYPEDHPIAWRFDPARREYLRWQDGAPHLDAAGTQVASAAVLVQRVAVRDAVYWGERGYHELTLTGRGEATLYANGRKRPATWRRGSYADPTRFFDAQGEEIPLPPGKLFVQMLGAGVPVDEKP